VSLLTDRSWKVMYDSDESSLIEEFYNPALSCAVRYHRTTGYFSARVLTLVARGIDGLIQNDGRMKLVVGCILHQEEVAAIEKGYSLRDTVAARLMANPLTPASEEQANALELLSWMVANGYLEVKVAVPCDLNRKPTAGLGVFHSKAGIIEDQAGNRLAFSGSINETPAGWLLGDSPDAPGGNWEDFHVFLDWAGGREHVSVQEESFARLWADRAKRCLVVDVPVAVRDDLLKFLSQEGELPKRLRESQAPYVVRRQSKENADPEVKPAAPGPTAAVGLGIHPACPVAAQRR
jgi:hypothetical protein